MNAEASRRREWAYAVPLAGLAVAALLAVFWPTFLSMENIWNHSDTFAHGYLVAPISAWLIWRIRGQVAQITPCADWRGVLLVLAAGAGWLLADAGSVTVVAQYSAVAMLIGAIWAVVGLQAFRAMSFPLLFLLMAVPAGEFLIPPMMNFTADFVVAALRLTGFPVYREGLHFSIPSGDWSVIEACSGVRYLIASIMLGLLYAYLTYRSWHKRLLFVIGAALVPVLANGMRGYLIVMIVHLSENKYGLGADHVLFGWVFFGLVMLAFFWVGTFWREDDKPQLTRVPVGGTPSPIAAVIVFAGAVVAVGLAWAGYGNWLTSRPAPAVGPLAVTVGQDWQSNRRFVELEPHWLGADRRFTGFYVRSDQQVMLDLNYYATQRQGAELINSQNYVVPIQDPRWAKAGTSVRKVEIAGEHRRVRELRLRSSTTRMLVWQWNLVDGKSTVDDALGSLQLAWARVRLQPDDGASVLIATPYEDNPAEARMVLAAFAAAVDPAVAEAMRQARGQ